MPEAVPPDTKVKPPLRRTTRALPVRSSSPVALRTETLTAASLSGLLAVPPRTSLTTLSLASALSPPPSWTGSSAVLKSPPLARSESPARKVPRSFSVSGGSRIMPRVWTVVVAACGSEDSLRSTPCMTCPKRWSWAFASSPLAL